MARENHAVVKKKRRPNGRFFVQTLRSEHWFAKKRVSPDRDLELVSSFCPPLDPLLVLGDAPLSVELKIIHEEHSWPQRTAQRNDFLAVALVHERPWR
jgi:hypothetical protein